MLCAIIPNITNIRRTFNKVKDLWRDVSLNICDIKDTLIVTNHSCKC